MGCAGGIAKAIISDCTTSKIGGLEIIAWVFNRRDLNITYDDATWDLNPEGIGVQPMLANVTLQVSFIGGHGLEEPVSRLQNALTSNFYANTEMYDERSETTNKKIGGQDYTKYEDEFIKSLQKQPEYQLISDILGKKEFNFGSYIGKKDNNFLSYHDIVAKLYDDSKTYLELYKSTFYMVLDRFGLPFTGLYFSTLYRTINKMEFYTDTNAPTGEIELLGEFDPLITDLSTLINNFKNSINDVVDTVNICIDILKVMDPIIDAKNLSQTEFEIKKEFKSEISGKIDDMINFEPLKLLSKKRNELIDTIDKLNFMVNIGKDATISGTTEAPVYFDTTLNLFVSNDFYNMYGDVFTYLNNGNTAIKQNINDSLDFENDSTLTQSMYPTSVCGPILLSLTKTNKDNIFNILVVNNGGVDAISPELHNFFQTKLTEVYSTLDSIYEGTIIDLPKAPTSPTNEIVYSIVSTDEVFDNNEGALINKIYSNKLPLTDKLNFYKP